MIERIAAGTPQAHVAEQMLVSRTTVSKWWRRWLADGDAGLEDRPYLHCAVDDHSRVAYVEVHDNEKAETLIGFWRRAQDWFWARGMTVDEVMSGNSSNCRSRVFAEALAQPAIKHCRTRPLPAPIEREGGEIQPHHRRRVPLLGDPEAIATLLRDAATELVALVR